LYSGPDNNNPEILDYGIYSFDNHNWADLYINFKENLNAIIARKLPPFKQLETYLIPPFESVIPISVRYPEDERVNKIEQLNWEMRKSLVHSEEGYLAEHYDFDGDIGNSLVENSGLALRKEYATRINQFLKNNSLFLAGLIFPQTLVKNIFSSIKLPRNPILLYKDNDAYNMFVYKSGSFPECSRFAYQAETDDCCDKLALTKMIDNITVDRMSLYHSESQRIFVFNNNLSTHETEFIKNVLKMDMRIISDNLEQAGYADNFADYFLLSLAHKIIGELYFTV